MSTWMSILIYIMLRKIKGTFENFPRKLNSDLETNNELKNPLITDNFTAFLGE